MLLTLYKYNINQVVKKLPVYIFLIHKNTLKRVLNFCPILMKRTSLCFASESYYKDEFVKIVANHT